MHDRSPPSETIKMPPSETIIAEARCQPGKWVTEGKPRLMASVTTERLVLSVVKPAGNLIDEVPFWKIQSVESKTVYWFFGVPHVQIRVKCSDGQSLEFVSSGIGVRKARRLAKALTDRIEVPYANPKDTSTT